MKAGKTKVKQVALTFHVCCSAENWSSCGSDPAMAFGASSGNSLRIGRETSQTTAPQLQQPPISSSKSLRHLGQMGEAFDHILSHRKLSVYFQAWQAETAFPEANGQWLTWSEAQKLPILAPSKKIGRVGEIHATTRVILSVGCLLLNHGRSNKAILVGEPGKGS